MHHGRPTFISFSRITTALAKVSMTSKFLLICEVRAFLRPESSGGLQLSLRGCSTSCWIADLGLEGVPRSSDLDQARFQIGLLLTSRFHSKCQIASQMTKRKDLLRFARISGVCPLSFIWQCAVPRTCCAWKELGATSTDSDGAACGSALKASASSSSSSPPPKRSCGQAQNLRSEDGPAYVFFAEPKYLWWWAQAAVPTSALGWRPRRKSTGRPPGGTTFPRRRLTLAQSAANSPGPLAPGSAPPSACTLSAEPFPACPVASATRRSSSTQIPNLPAPRNG